MRTTLPTISTLTFLLAGCGGGGDGGSTETLPGKQATYSIGGSVSGLTGTGLVLANGADRANVSSNGSFRFSTELPSGARYGISVETHPVGQRCSIETADGEVGTSPVNVAVTCSNSQFTVGGTVTGLQGTGLELQNNGNDVRAVESSSPGFPNFSFGRALNSNDPYSVTVSRHPTNPDQICEIANGAGTISDDVEDVAVSCVRTLAISSNTPLNAAIDVSRSTALTINFSSLLNTATVGNASVTLISSAGNEPTSITATGNQITVTPDRQLLPATTYTLTLSTAIRGIDEQRMQSAFVITFRTRDAAWQPAVLVGASSDSTSSSPKLAVHGTGFGYAVWSQWNGTHYNIHANRFDPATSWSPSQPLTSSRDLGSAYNPDVAIDDLGNTTTVWTQYNTARTEVGVYSLRAPRNQGWIHYAPLSPNLPIAQPTPPASPYPKITTDSENNVVVAWNQFDGTIYQTHVSVYRYSVGNWNTTALLNNMHGNIYRPPLMSRDFHGNTHLAWNQTDAGVNRVLTTRFNATSGWSEITSLDPATSDSRVLAVSSTAEGTGAILWSNGSAPGPYYLTIANSNGEWSSAQMISDDPFPTLNINPFASLNASGRNRFGHGAQVQVNNVVNARRYVVNVGWTASEPIDLLSGEDPQLVVDSANNILVVWRRRVIGSFGIYAKRYTPSAGWGSTQRININNAHFDVSISPPQLGMDSSGNALVVWYQQRSTSGYDLWAARFH